MNTASFSNRVWKGDSQTVAEARERFNQGPLEQELLPYASVLYSFRSDPACARALIELEPVLQDNALL